MISDFIVSVILLVSLFVVNWKMGLLMIAVLPIALILLVFGLKKGGKIETENGNRLADMVSLFVEYVKGIPLLKAFSESKKFDRELEKSTQDFGESSKQTSKYKAKLLANYGFFLDLSYLVMALAGIILVLNGSLNLMIYLIYIVISKEFYKPFTAMETYWMNYLKVTDSYRRIRKVLDAPIVEEPKRPLQIKGSDIEFRNLGYDDLLGSISIVMQDVRLFADTVAGNIRIGKAGATDAEIIIF
jgi:ATP-binding cassette subfamily B protein IrtB